MNLGVVLAIVIVGDIACGDTRAHDEARVPVAAPAAPIKDARGGDRRGDARGLDAAVGVHALVTRLPSGCERDNRDEVIDAVTKERGQFIEIRCEAGEIDTFVEIELDTEVFASFDAYVEKRLREPWRDATTRLTTEPLADGWITARGVIGNPQIVVESQRVIAGWPVSCHAFVAAGEVARVEAICKAVSAPR